MSIFLDLLALLCFLIIFVTFYRKNQLLIRLNSVRPSHRLKYEDRLLNNDNPFMEHKEIFITFLDLLVDIPFTIPIILICIFFPYRVKLCYKKVTETQQRKVILITCLKG